MRNLTQTELEDEGVRLSSVAHRDGVVDLTDDEANALYLWETWKDGADWEVIEQMMASTVKRGDVDTYLVDVYGYRH
jgi:hypothetical protein